MDGYIMQWTLKLTMYKYEDILYVLIVALYCFMYWLLAYIVLKTIKFCIPIRWLVWKLRWSSLVFIVHTGTFVHSCKILCIYTS